MSEKASSPASDVQATPAEPADRASQLTILGIILVAAPALHLVLIPLGFLGVPGASAWVEATYDPFSINVVLACMALAPGFFCLTAALHRAPSVLRLVAASIAPALILGYALYITYYMLTQN